MGWALIILPPSFHGSPRALNQFYYDVMVLVIKFGKPHIFLTMTRNQKWPGIVDNLLPGQTVTSRPDLAARDV